MEQNCGKYSSSNWRVITIQRTVSKKRTLLFIKTHARFEQKARTF